MFHELTIKEAINTYRVSAECRKCRHKREIDLRRLSEELGEEFRLEGLRERLKCQCGEKGPILSPIRIDNTWGHSSFR
jgi:hypothetical protein